jgi:hypothetical protein
MNDVGRESDAGDALLMNSVADRAGPSGDATARVLPELSLLRLYALRVFYLVMAGGIAVYYWPAVFNHTDEFVVTGGIRTALLAGLGLTAVLGLRYPLQMLPLLLFELIWKAIYLIGFALPLWRAGRIDAAAEDVKACLMVIVLFPPSHGVMWLRIIF